MENVTVKSQGKDFTIDVDGNVREPHRVSQFVLDDARLEASHHFLNRANHLNKAQRDYWMGVARTTVLANFNSGSGHRKTG